MTNQLQQSTESVYEFLVKKRKICDNFSRSQKDFLQIKLKSYNKLKKKNPTILALKSVAKSMIKQSIIETLYFFYTKLRLVGVGYRVTDLKKINEKLLVLKLGYSHSIFFQVPNDTTISHLKQTNFSFSNTSFARVTQLAAFIRSYKKPEPYKGKGILHQNEKILLKEGKKV
mgnify:CR=1 FL=1